VADGGDGVRVCACQLIHNFPEDFVTREGDKFWTGAKRFPQVKGVGRPIIWHKYKLVGVGKRQNEERVLGTRVGGCSDEDTMDPPANPAASTLPLVVVLSPHQAAHFDPSNDQHVLFVMAAANILAVNHGVCEPPEKTLIGHDHQFRNVDFIKVRERGTTAESSRNPCPRGRSAHPA
jgi:hypothetical protein